MPPASSPSSSPSAPPTAPHLQQTLTEGPLLAALTPGQTSLHIHATTTGALKTPTTQLYHLYQRPVHLSIDPSSTLLLLIGVLRGGVVLHPQQARPTVRSHHFIIPGCERLTPSCVTVEHPEEHTLLIRVSAESLTLVYDPTNGVLTHPPPATPAGTQLTTLFHRLLSSIDELATKKHAIDTENTVTENRITAYNTLLTTPARLTRPSLTPIPTTAPTLHPPSPVSGRIVYLNVALPKLPGALECTIRKPSLWKRRSTLGERVRRERVYVTAVPVASRLSIPFVLDSHRPITIALELLLHGSGIPLATFRYDILDYSQPTEDGIVDTSRDALAPVRAMMLPREEEKAQGITTSRVQLPIPLEELRKLITPGSYVTLLGGVFTLTLSPGLTERLSAASILGPHHVVPFVRAAILRRVLDADVLKPPDMASAPAVRRMQKVLLQRCDECLPSFRRAEDALVRAREVFERVEQGFVEECYDRGERVVLDDATRSARACYGMLRRSFEGMWSFGDAPG